MARVPYPDPAELPEEIQDLLATLPPLNIFRMLAGGEGLLPAFSRFGGYLLNKTQLDPVLREIAILRVGVRCGASYEVHQHEAISRQVGMSEALIAAVHDGPDATGLDDPQREVLRYTDDLVANVRASDETMQPLIARLSTRELQELTITIGYYLLVSRYLETFGVDIEDADTTLDLTR